MNGNGLNNLENEKNNFFSLKVENKDNIIENITKSTVHKENKEEITYNNESPKYKLSYNFLLNYINDKDKEKLNDQNEFFCNLLLMPSEISIKEKADTFFNLVKLYKKTGQKDLILRLNKKIDKLYEKEKIFDIKCVLYSFLKSSDVLLEDYKNYFYAFKYANKCLGILNDPKNQISESDSTQIKNELELITQLITSQIETKKIFFKDPSNFERIKEISNLIDLIIKDKNNKETDENDQNNKYLYVINKEWIKNFFSFITSFLEYSAKEDKDKEKFFEKSFDYKYISKCYLKEKVNENEKEMPPFPGNINNYEITSLKDCWKDNENEDENDYIKKKAEYVLVNKKDWTSITDIFGFTNIIRRKKDNLDLIPFKFILFDRRIKPSKSNINFLKEKYIQVNKGINIMQLKYKIFRCTNSILEPNNEEKRICFFILERKNSNILVEMVYSFIQSIQMFESIHIRQIEFRDEESLEKLFSVFDQKKHILIVEIIRKDDMNYFVQIEKGNYKCTNCFKQLKDEGEIYKCQFCHFSVFCSQNCANNSDYHREIDKKLKKICEKQFTLSDIFSEKYDYLLTRGSRGRVKMANDRDDETFFVSSIHCLSNSLYLTKYFLSEKYKNDQKPGKTKYLSSIYYKLINALWENQNKDIRIGVQEFCKYLDLTVSNNSDPYEFIFKLLDLFNDELNKASGEDKKEIEGQKKGETDEETSKRFSDNDLKYKHSIITDLFVGQYKSISKCLLCGNESITFPNFAGMSLSIPEKKTNIQIKLFTSNLRFYYVNLKINEKTEMKDILFKSIEYLSSNKQEYIKFLLNNKSKDFIINNNVTEVPENILYNNLQFIEINKEFKIQSIFNTSYSNCPKDKKGNKNIFYNNKNGNRGFDQIKYKDYKESLDKKGSTELVIFEKDINSNKPNHINIYIYPFAEIEKETMFIGTKKVPKILCYPVIISIHKKSSLEEMNTLIFNKFKRALMGHFQNQSDSFNIFFPHFSGNWDNYKIKEGKCPICQKLYNKTSFGCSLYETFDKSTPIENLLEKQGKDRPIILYAKTDVYDQQRHIYRGVDLFFQKNLEIENKDTISLYDCLDAFNNYRIEDQEKCVCKICNKEAQFKRKFTLYKLPIYLIIKLKKHTQIGKADKVVEYKEILDLKDYVLGSDKNRAIYDLYAVILNKKFLNISSYSCYCKNYGSWIGYSKEGLGAVESPISKDAYILFYKRRDIE